MPTGMRKACRELVNYSGVRVRSDRLLGFITLFGLGVAFAVSFDATVLLGLEVNTSLLIFLAAYAVFEAGSYMWLWFKAEGKGRFVDGVLPDALQLMSMNMRAGLTTDRAFILAARPEFGPLEDEIRRAGKAIMAGSRLKDALLGMTKRIRSRTLDSAMKMIADGMESGGEIASLLEQTSLDILNTRLVEKEVRANVLMYVIFIFFAAGIGAPLVFGISTHLMAVMSEQMSRFAAIDFAKYQAGGGGFAGNLGVFTGFSGMGKAASVSPDFLMLYAVVSLLVTSFFGSLTIGLIKDGKEKQGVKYMPLLLVLSLGVFFATRIFVSAIFKI
ncbi:MAG: hypothetical protein FJY76_04130 [Candidatus Aenigmarchaeota archaeon]|nr:hypothetical protein [Candidatus Aenigmarchaeota archaeon]